MNRSALLAAVLVGLLVVQGSAHAVVGSSAGTGTAACIEEDSSNVQSAFPDSVFADSENCSDESGSEDGSSGGDSDEGPGSSEALGDVGDAEEGSNGEGASSESEATESTGTGAASGAEGSGASSADGTDGEDESASETIGESDSASRTTASESADADVETETGSDDGGDGSENGAASEGSGETSGETPIEATAGSAGASDEGAQAGGAGAGSTQAASGSQVPTGRTAGGSQAPDSGATGGSATGGPATGSAIPSGATASETEGAAAGSQAAGAGSAQQGAGAASPDADFEVRRASTDAPIGASGTLTVAIENTGEDAENAVVSLQSGSSAITFGGSPTASQFVGEWEEGETRIVEVDASVAPGVSQRSYPIQASVAYEDEEGNQARSAPLSFGVTPEDAQDFALDSVESSLSVGSEGTIGGTITNEGPGTAENAVLVFAGNGSEISPRQSEVVLGDIRSGESISFEYPVAVQSGIAPGERQVPFVVQYENENGDGERSETLNAQVTVGENTEGFEVVDVSSELEPGESGTVEVTLENQVGDLSDASISLQSLSSSVLFGETANASQFVGEWADGETRTIEVRASAARDATEGEYPMQATVAYTDADNERDRAGPLSFGVEVGAATEDVEVLGVSSELEPGETGTVRVRIENTGEDASDATATLQSRSSAIAFGRAANATKFLGDLESGESETIEVRASAAEAITEGEYPMQVSLSYTDPDGQSARAGPVAFGVGVGEARDDFQVVGVESSVPVGGQGTIRVTLNNTEENTTDATVSLRSLSGEFTLGRAANASTFVGNWTVGERKTVSFQAQASNETERRSYPFRTSVSYTDRGDQRVREGPYTIGVRPLREQAFTIANASSNLSVGEEGRVSATIANEGPQPARNAVVRLSVGNENIDVLQEEVAIGTLAAGETATVSFPVEVSESAEAGTQQFSLVVEYDDREGDSHTSESLDTRVEIEPQQDPLVVGGEEASTQDDEPLRPGGSTVVSIPVTNDRDVVLRNVEAQAFTNDPLSLADDRAFIAELGPGETANLTFEISASGDARPGTYPLSMDFQYETPDGDTKLSDTYEVPIAVEEPDGGALSSLTGGEDGGFPWLVVILALLVAGAAGYVLYQRRS